MVQKVIGQMIRSVSRYKNIIVLLVLFFFAEYLRVITDYLIDRSADNLIFCIIAIIWAVYLRRRILDEYTQKVLLGLAMSMIFLFAIRTCKYVLFDKNTILWYMYYIPLTMMPLLVFFMSKRIRGQETSSTHRYDKYYLIGLVLVNGMILTNDRHQFVFRFMNADDIDTYTYGIGYVITMAWIIIFTGLAIYNLYRVCSLPQSRKKIWIPVLPLLFCIIASSLDVLHMVPKINDTKIYLFQEIVLVTVISIVEACIYIGVIPSNDGYEEIFANSRIKACIIDSSHNVVYSSHQYPVITEAMALEGKKENVMLDDDTRLHANVINGGTLYYTEDIREIVKLNHMLEEAAEVISAENEMIEAENRLLAEETMYKTKNKLYDDIARLVRPQVLMIEDCLMKCEQESEAFYTHMAKATVLNAYIKRRINLSLLAMEQKQISYAELSLAIGESLTYLNYSNVSTSVWNYKKDGSVDAGSCIEAYDAFEELIEAYYGNMTAFMVTIDERKNQILLRMTIETTEGASFLPICCEAYEIDEEEDMLNVTIRFGEGGDA